ncbi:EamA family transporter RarD [Brevibacillus choshinensis]|uniref:EamA family transporter RarD n=1 Tax=Brevibacillus choshinensis TaxID=54911 RepID=UPI002E2009A9|nr:EamA family transporter RarD [Brevibacillus choshinensis]MED4586070.1 EamA family transporter RarD [Brevibacillus choshinensis]MED4752193.1 EamA family transporter RarD [Brevibacillus choshinensis]
MKQGVLYGIIAYFAWGLLPVYWKLFQSMGAWEILAHRIVWSLIFVLIMIVITKRWRKLWEAAPGLKMKGALLLCSLLISANWLLYIWAVNSNQVMETSLGYYMNPLISVLLGVVFLKEKLRVGQWVALGMAALGVLYITLMYGQMPWVALSLAMTFAFYGLAKKVVNLEAMIGLAWETIFVAPIALIYLIMLQVNGTGTAIELEGWKLAMLALAGVGTAMPLYWFAQATKRLPLSTLGFIQYLSPTIQLLSAVFLFGEKFTTTHLVSFSLIWGALLVFTISSMRKKTGSVQMNPEVAIKKQA